MLMGLNALLIMALKKNIFFQSFLVSPPQRRGGGGGEGFLLNLISASFHGALADIHHLYLVNFGMLKTFIVAHSSN